MKTSRIICIFLYLAVCTSIVYGNCADDVAYLSSMPLRQPNRHWGEDGNLGISDENLNYEWYSVVYNGWQFILVDSTEKPNYTDCSAYYPVYLRDTHPSIETLTETSIDAVACKRDYLYPCDIQHQVKIRKCGDEIQYYLPPTKSYSAFCFKNHSKIFEPPDISDVILGDIGITPELKFTETLIPSPFGNSINYDPYFQFRCLFNVQQDYFYKVQWYVNGALLVSYGPTTEINDLLFHQSVLIDNKITMGFNIYCGISALTSDGPNASVTDMVFSESYYAGIKVINTTIYIDKGDTAVIQLQSTMPIGCRYNDPPGDDCIENFQIFSRENEGFQCKAGVANLALQPNQRCSNGLQTQKKGSTWDPDTVFNFSIVTTDMNYNDKRLFYLLLQFPDIMGHEIWRNYNFPVIKVHLLYTFTRDCYYEQQRKNGQLYTGTFLMYRNTKYGIEVQEQTKSCNRGRATCACGVAIRAGKDVFMINRCGSINYLGFTKCEDGGILQVVRINHYKYDVFTPIGTKITIRLFQNEREGRYEGTMNIDITMAPKDLYNIEGLCGQFDNNPANDFQHRDGTVSAINSANRKSHFADFTESWSLTSEETKQLNLFLTGQRTLDSWGDLNGLFCVCESNKPVAEATCYPTQYLNCTLSRSITGTKCNVLNRRRRSADGNYKDDKELDRLLQLMTALDTPEIETRVKRQDIQNIHITEAAAEELCEDKIAGSLAVQEYSEVGGNEDPNEVIKQCTFDVVAGNDTSWAAAHVESINNIVKNMMELDPIYVANNSEKVVRFYKNTCPGNCSNTGECNDKSECDCFGFFHGAECDIDERDPLTIDDIEGGGECDLADGDECLCFHVRSSNILEGFRCKANISKITISGERELISTPSFFGEYEDIFTGVCCIQDNVIDTEGLFVTKYDFSISNNGITYGNVKSVHVYDSTCQEATFTSFENASFSLKPEYCFIDGGCVAENDMSPAGCLACQSLVDEYNWTVNNPCQNKGNCTGEIYGYTCSCAHGYGGNNCEYDINECESDPCENDGTCSDQLNGFTCSCVAGFTGTNCEININECSSHPCQNNGICKDGINMYSCMCPPGFEGTHCETDIDECSTNPCKNGGTCFDRVNGYTCECVVGTYGVNCSAEIDSCAANPCENGGTCGDINNSRICQCVDGYAGSNCEIDINDYENNPCQNGGSCADFVNSYKCTCVTGYEGTNCTTDINECSSNPCKNDGACVDLVNGYKCTCVAGYNGDDCDQNINECSSDPCKNSGTCKDLVNGYECICVAGYNGTHCYNNIDDCYLNSCKNGGTCKDLVNDYECTCAAGYDGINCDNNIYECLSNPCKNGGTCNDLINGYECTCVVGYGGTNCNKDVNECSSSPCENGGSCKDLVNGYECICVAGFDGVKCENDINDCSSDPCKNGGTCTDLVNEYECTCLAGYDGTDCEKDINECSLNPCKNGGTCEDFVNEYVCTCVAGYDGMNCDNNINECSSNPCENGGTCNDIVDGYECTCVAGYDGMHCDKDINECSPDPCKNGATCRDLVNNFECTCAAGYGGSNCEYNINECSPDPCLNGGSCEDLVNGYECTCVTGYNGTNCENNINECLPDPCKNEGTCKDLINGYECTCAAGYDGIDCDNNINECSSNPCENGGTCNDFVNGYDCTCAAGYNGINCDNDFDECSLNPCENNGICKDRINMFTCECTPGFKGEQCEINLDECNPDPCQNAGSCEDRDNGYTCICAEGYFGVNCSTDVNECLSNPCENKGTCEDKVNGRICHCIDGYEGLNCEIDINECSNSPCMNGGSCRDLVNGYECICVQGYDGTDCDIYIDECFSDPCKNGGRCKDLVNKYECTCVAGYEGQKCENDINECLSNPCKNGGTCTDSVNKFNCTCAAGYKGAICDTDIDECNSNPCENGGTCTDLVNGYECTCVPGYDGMKCNNDIDDCSPYPCKNSGTCKDLTNGYECTCVAGYDGINCDYDINECSSDPCKNGGTCKDLVNEYECTCAAGYDGLNCNNVTPTTTMSPDANFARATISMRFPFESKFNVTDPNLKSDVTFQLTKEYKDNIGNALKALVILRLSKGSVRVEFEVIYEKETSSVSDLIKTSIAYLNGDKSIEVFNETVSAITVEINSITVTNETSTDESRLCSVFEILQGPCQENQKCSIMEGNFSCVAHEDDGIGLKIVIIVIVCVLFVPIIIFTITCLAIRKIRNRGKELPHSQRLKRDSIGSGKSWTNWTNPKLMGSYRSRLSGRSFTSGSYLPDYSKNSHGYKC
ncbi:neurogenic locus Notch protein-like [Ruditapes philippinarum]|uniref:neurogenic locus Notch protein-like n=1 Tax=Ruditapes philippinarum TaxID=129788 RepID=UPI00295C0E8C|nr:neurogenic locus Notch protein-like [Ruditapes philippinarum]